MINLKTDVVPPQSSGVQQTPARTQPVAHTPAVCGIADKEHHYFVETEDRKMAYRVYWDGTSGQCTCADFAKRGIGYTCAHITAVKNRPIEEECVVPRKETREILTRKFDEDEVCEANGVKAIKLSSVIDRLNEAFGPMEWSFTYGEPDDCGDIFVCNGKLEVLLGGQKTFKSNAGSCQYQEGAEAGDPYVDNPECGYAISIGDAKVAAVHAALKKCALLLGIGLEQSSSQPAIELASRERPVYASYPASSDKKPGDFAQTYGTRAPF